MSLHLDRNQARARDVLEKAGIHVSFRERGAQLRVSPALFNTHAEIGRFLETATAFA